MKTRSFSRRFFGPTLTLLALVAGCSDSNTTPDAATDVTQPPVDASIPTDTSTPTDAGAAQPRLVPVSAMGHDRFFGVTFDPAGNFYATGVVADSTETTADFRTVVAKFNASGALDTTFGTNGFATHNLATGTNGEVTRGIVVQPSGKIVVVATVEHAGASDMRDRDIALARFNANGMIDTTFGMGGVVTLDLSAGEVSGSSYVADSAWGLSAYPDGRLVVTGAQKRMGATDTDFAVIRLTVDGMRDMTFGTNGVTAVDINNRSASPRTATILADGSVVAAGYMDDGGVVKPVLFKLNPMGQLDTTFATNGIFSPTVLMAATEAYGAALQGTSFVTAGYGRNAATESLDWLSLRVSAGGMLDTTYGTSGVARLDLAMFNDNARSLVVLPDNRVMLVGGGRPTEMNVDGMIAVLTMNGQPDTSFGARGIRTYDFGGASDFFWGAALSPDRTRVALVGTKGVGTGMGNDDAVVHVMPVTPSS